jgi:NitT/TauT family transport system ATP-binding protein
MTMEPLPHTTSSRIIGLLEALNDRGGRDDIYKLARELNLELGDLLAAIRAAETLEFVTTPGGDVELNELGRKLVRARMAGRKKLMQAQLKKLPLVAHLYELLEKAENKRVQKETMLEEISRLLPDEDAAQLFDTAINWSRYAELFSYDQDTGDCFFPE